MTFYEHNNSGPQASLGKAVDVHSACVQLHPICTGVLVPRSDGLVEFFFKKHCLDILLEGLVMCSMPPEATQGFKRWQDFTAPVLKHRSASRAREAVLHFRYDRNSARMCRCSGM